MRTQWRLSSSCPLAPAPQQSSDVSEYAAASERMLAAGIGRGKCASTPVILWLLTCNGVDMATNSGFAFGLTVVSTGFRRQVREAIRMVPLAAKKLPPRRHTGPRNRLARH